jgi:hypothetical protein
MKTAENQQTTIRDTVRSVFDLGRKAAVICDALAKQLPRCTSIEQHAAHRAYTILNDATRALEHLEADIAESRTLGRYLT